MGLEKKYEIFIGSTYEDLKDERRVVQEFIVSQGHIPVGMELFSADHEDQWQVIKKVIDQCDYYVLIIAARYGSTTKTGISYTEKEYRYAKQQKKPTIVFLLSTDGLKSWPHAKFDADNDMRKRLERFRQAVGTKYTYFWNDPRDLADKVRSHLSRWINRNPQNGWIRAAGGDARELHVYYYLFNALKRHPPHVNLPQESEDLYALSTTLDNIRSVTAAMNALISYYAKAQIESGVRIYFAYNLKEPITATQDGATIEAHYRFGISNTTEKPWRLGLLIGRESNIHTVYQDSNQHNIPDTSLARPGENQRVTKEGSVFAAAVTYSGKSVGVVGLSSPKKQTTSKYIGFGTHLAVIFGALFFAYAQQCGGEGDILERIRSELSDHFESELNRKFSH